MLSKIKNFLQPLTDFEFQTYKRWYLLFLVVFPSWVIGTFIGFVGGLIAPSWQSGNVADYFRLFITVSLPYFLPFFLFSMISFLLLFRSYSQYKNNYWIRMGVYSGAFLAWKFFFIQFIYIFSILFSGSDQFTLDRIASLSLYEVADLSLELAQVVGVYILAHLVPLIIAKYRPKILTELFLVATLVPMFLLIIFAIEIFWTTYLVSMNRPSFSADLSAFTAPVLYGIYIIAPYLAAHFATLLSLQLKHESKTSKTEATHAAFPWIGYFTLYAGSIAYGVERTIAEYNTLPTTPPRCYIATAASQGHQHVVGSWEVIMPEVSGSLRTFRVSHQLQLCKYLEFVIQNVSPTFHKKLRHFYNSCGPKLAKKIRNPWIADVVYFSLKPIEYAARLVLFFFPQHKKHVNRLYR